MRGRSPDRIDRSATAATAAVAATVALIPTVRIGIGVPAATVTVGATATPTATVTASVTVKPTTDAAATVPVTVTAPATGRILKQAALTPVAPSTATVTPATVAPASTTPASATPAPAVPTQAPTTPSAGSGASQPAGAGHGDSHGHGTARTPARHARAHTASPAGAHATRAASLTSAVAPVAAGSSSHAHPARIDPAHRALHGAASASSPTPIVTTITKIVGVIPAFVWALIGGLLALALALGVRTRVAALRAGRLEKQRGELLEDVGLLQAALLPVAPARLGPVGTSVAYRPADGPGAGGDFYDLFALQDGRLAVIVGDVSGHGRPALPHTALVRFTLRAYLEAGLSPRSAVQTAGAVLERQLGESFATVAAAIYHPRERTLTYACAGHPAPIMVGSRALEPITVCSAPPIGVGARTGTRQTVVSVPGRSQICFHTDGVTEARVGVELFGARRLTETLAELGPLATAPELLERVAARTDSRPDDMAACLLSVEGGEGPPKALVEELELDREQASSDRIEPFLRACGVPPAEIVELVRSTREAAQRSGSALLELRLCEGAPEVTLRRENVAFLHPPQMGRRAGGGAAR
jgi:Stage II sporulation protein E (SpoIIE)